MSFDLRGLTMQVSVDKAGLKQAERAVVRIGKSANDMGKAFARENRKIQRQVGLTTHEMRGLGNEVKRTSSAMGRLGESLGSPFKYGLPQMQAYSAALRGLSSAVRGAVGGAVQFEKSMSKITGLVGVAREQVQAWEGELERMSVSSGQSLAKVSEGLFFVTSAGLRGATAIETLEAATKAAAVGLGDVGTIANATTSAVNAYGAEALSGSRATDVLVATVREGKLQADELAGSIGTVIPIASKMNIEFHEVGAAMALMSRTGTDAATGTTQLRQILNSLISPSAEAEKAMKGLGVSAQGLRETFGGGLLDGLLELKRLTEEYGEETLAELFPNIQALSGLFDLLGGDIEETKRLFGSVRDSAGDTSRAFKNMEGDVGLLWDQLDQHLNVALTNLGKTILPVLNKGLEGMISFFDGKPDERAADFAASLAFLGSQASKANPEIAEFNRIASESTLPQGLKDLWAVVATPPDTSAWVQAAEKLADARKKMREEIEKIRSLKQIAEDPSATMVGGDVALSEPAPAASPTSPNIPSAPSISPAELERIAELNASLSEQKIHLEEQFRALSMSAAELIEFERTSNIAKGASEELANAVAKQKLAMLGAKEEAAELKGVLSELEKIQKANERANADADPVGRLKKQEQAERLALRKALNAGLISREEWVKQLSWVEKRYADMIKDATDKGMKDSARDSRVQRVLSDGFAESMRGAFMRIGKDGGIKKTILGLFGGIGQAMRSGMLDQVSIGASGYFERFSKSAETGFNDSFKHLKTLFKKDIAPMFKDAFKGFGDKFKGVGKFFQRVPVASIATSAMGVYQGIKSGNKLGSALSGMGLGASIGTAIVPGIGTAIGAVVGAVGGFVASLFGGKKKKEKQIAFHIEEMVSGRLTQAGDMIDKGLSDAVYAWDPKRASGWGEGGKHARATEKTLRNTWTAVIEEIEAIMTALPVDVFSRVGDVRRATLTRTGRLPGDEGQRESERTMLSFDRDNKDWKKIMADWERFLKGYSGNILTSLENYWVDSLTAMGFGVAKSLASQIVGGLGFERVDKSVYTRKNEAKTKGLASQFGLSGTQAWVNEQLASIDALEGEARAAEAKKFLENVNTVVEAFNILEGNTGIKGAIAQITNLTASIGGMATLQGGFPVLKEIHDRMRELFELGDHKNLRKLIELRKALLDVQSQMIGTVSSMLTTMSSISDRLVELGSSPIDTRQYAMQLLEHIQGVLNQPELDPDKRIQFLEQFKQVLDFMYQEERKIIEARKEELEGFRDVLESIQDVSDSLKNTKLKIQTDFEGVRTKPEQIGLIKAQIKFLEDNLPSLDTEHQKEKGKELESLYQRLYQRTLEAFGTQSSELYTTYEQVMKGLSGLSDYFNVEDELLRVTKLIEEHTRNTGINTLQTKSQMIEAVAASGLTKDKVVEVTKAVQALDFSTIDIKSAQFTNLLNKIGLTTAEVTKVMTAVNAVAAQERLTTAEVVKAVSAAGLTKQAIDAVKSVIATPAINSRRTQGELEWFANVFKRSIPKFWDKYIQAHFIEYKRQGGSLADMLTFIHGTPAPAGLDDATWGQRQSRYDKWLRTNWLDLLSMSYQPPLAYDSDWKIWNPAPGGMTDAQLTQLLEAAGLTTAQIKAVKSAVDSSKTSIKGVLTENKDLIDDVKTETKGTKEASLSIQNNTFQGQQDLLRLYKDFGQKYFLTVVTAIDAMHKTLASVGDKLVPPPTPIPKPVERPTADDNAALKNALIAGSRSGDWYVNTIKPALALFKRIGGTMQQAIDIVNSVPRPTGTKWADDWFHRLGSQASMRAFVTRNWDSFHTGGLVPKTGTYQLLSGERVLNTEQARRYGGADAEAGSVNVGGIQVTIHAEGAQSEPQAVADSIEDMLVRTFEDSGRVRKAVRRTMQGEFVRQ